jgi:integrase
VPVPEFVLDELSVQCKEKSPGDLVFSVPEGGYMPRPRSTDGWFAAAVRRAGVQTITPHDLRHTCASLAVSAGSTCWHCSGCLATHQQRSLSTRMRTCSTTISTQ